MKRKCVSDSMHRTSLHTMLRNAGILSVQPRLYVLKSPRSVGPSLIYLFIRIKGWIECVGIADRGDYDLKQHSIHSGTNLCFEKRMDNISFRWIFNLRFVFHFSEILKQYHNMITSFTPHVIEPSFGFGRIMFTVLEHNFRVREESETRCVSQYHILPSVHLIITNRLIRFIVFFIAFFYIAIQMYNFANERQLWSLMFIDWRCR